MMRHMHMQHLLYNSKQENISSWTSMRRFDMQVNSDVCSSTGLKIMHGLERHCGFVVSSLQALLLKPEMRYLSAGQRGPLHPPQRQAWQQSGAPRQGCLRGRRPWCVRRVLGACTAIKHMIA